MSSIFVAGVGFGDGCVLYIPSLHSLSGLVWLLSFVKVSFRSSRTRDAPVQPSLDIHTRSACRISLENLGIQMTSYSALPAGSPRSLQVLREHSREEGEQPDAEQLAYDLSVDKGRLRCSTARLTLGMATTPASSTSDGAERIWRTHEGRGTGFDMGERDLGRVSFVLRSQKCALSAWGQQHQHNVNGSTNEALVSTPSHAPGRAGVYWELGGTLGGSRVDAERLISRWMEQRSCLPRRLPHFTIAHSASAHREEGVPWEVGDVPLESVDAHAEDDVTNAPWDGMGAFGSTGMSAGKWDESERGQLQSPGKREGLKRRGAAPPHRPWSTALLPDDRRASTGSCVSFSAQTSTQRAPGSDRASWPEPLSKLPSPHHIITHPMHPWHSSTVPELAAEYGANEERRQQGTRYDPLLRSSRGVFGMLPPRAGAATSSSATGNTPLAHWTDTQELTGRAEPASYAFIRATRRRPSHSHLSFVTARVEAPARPDTPGASRSAARDALQGGSGADPWRRSHASNASCRVGGRVRARTTYCVGALDDVHVNRKRRLIPAPGTGASWQWD
ncbi:hypothetical protein C8R45DRAFT_1076069 [Mycena sanguinolenta]|nr:hypothetical protein C8R45DRAFT_1076069 [Mycena sanguinolenta]